MGENKVDLIGICMASSQTPPKDLDGVFNALHDIVERALVIEDKAILQACDKLGLMGNGAWRNLKS